MSLNRRQLRAPVLLCAMCQVLYLSFAMDKIPSTAREMLFGGLCAALAVAFLLGATLLVGQWIAHLPQDSIWKNVAAALSSFCVILAMLQTIFWQVQFYARQFASGYLWVLFFALLSCLLGCTPQALLRSASVLWWVGGMVALVCVFGLAAQSQPSVLVDAPLTSAGVYAGFWAGFLLCPEYLSFLFADLAPQSDPTSKAQARKDSLGVLLLPFGVVGVQSLVLWASELIFGQPEGGVAGFEFLRSWVFLQFSRFDAVVLLFWLLLAFFRLRFLSFMLGQLWPDAKTKRKAGACDE